MLTAFWEFVKELPGRIMPGTKERRLAAIRALWGLPIERYRNLDLIANYHNLLKLESKAELVDDKTWNDLNFDSIFTKMDRCTSGFGQQYLYHMLREYIDNENILKTRFSLIQNMKDNQQLRESIQLNLFNVSGVSSYFAAFLLLCKSLPNTRYYRVFYVCSFLSALSVILIPFNSSFLFAALLCAVINIILNKVFSSRIYEFATGFSSLNALLVSALEIGRIDSEADDIRRLKNKRALLKSLKKKLGYLVIDKESLNEMALVVIEYLNMALLFDIIAYYRSVNTLLKHQEEILEVFNTVARLDAAISVASYLTDIKQYSNPVFTPERGYSFSNMYHPLIENAVSNSLPENSESVLITGSNMSGKTTFIKTVGINFILARTLYFCLAERVQLPELIVRSAIRRNDELEDGKSYFFVEIEELKKFIDLSNSGKQYLFLIDEIFRGTNTIERLSASTAVLNHLGSKNIVLVTTHDIELQSLLKGAYSMYHFSEQVEGDRFFFNYKIKEGPCSSGNAIKLLEIMRYPAEITLEAKQIAHDISAKNNRGKL